MFAGAVILYIMINLVLGNHYTYLDYLGAFTAWVNIGNSNWYIFSILFLYLVVYIVFKYSYDTRDLLHILMVAGMCLIYAVTLKCLGKESFWYNTVLVFPAGMFWAYEEKCLTAFIKKNWVYEGCVVIALLALGMSLAYVKNIVGFQISSMACFIGSRFGTGIKQLEPVGLHDEIIMDYSIHDAISAGFNKIIFVIRKDIEADFRERIGNRVEAICASLNVKIAYAFQDLSSIPTGYTVPNGRTKPWGTGQAVLAAKDLIHEPFAVINADDYYGKEAFRKLHDWLVMDHNDSAIAMAGFILKNTLSDNGGVTRGVCRVAEGHTHITDVVETSNIVKTVGNGMIGAEANGVKLDPGSYVSMNFWGFPAKEGHDPAFLTVLEYGFKDFFEKQVPANPQKAEYLLPTLIGGLLRDGKCTVKVLETKDNWFGVTYKEDKAAVVESFKKLIADGVYREELYSDL